MASTPRITAIDAFPYCPQGLAKPQLIVRVQTDAGITGWGESGFSFRELAVAGAVRHLATIAIGRDAFAIGALWQELYRGHYFEGCRSHMAAISAVDVALHDIKGQALDVPVYELLGGAQRNRVDCFATARGAEVSAIVAEAGELVDRGFTGVRAAMPPLEKTVPNTFDPRKSIALAAPMLAEVRERIGPAAMLGIDYHHRLSVPEAARLCQSLPRGTLDFLEEPIRAQTPEAYAMLRNMVDTPFAIGEEFASKWEFRPYIERQLTQFARIDVATVGGLTEAMKIGGWCEAHYIDVMPHNPLGPINTAATIHFAAALPNLALLEVRPHQVSDPLSVDGDIFPDQPVLDGASFALPTRSGLGVTVDLDRLAVAVERYRETNPTRLQRPDGSLTNA